MAKVYSSEDQYNQMSSTRRRADDDGHLEEPSGAQNYLMDDGPSSTGSGSQHSHVSMDKGVPSTIMEVVGSLHRRRHCQRRYFMHTFTMLATLTLAGAIRHHAAFVTRIGQRSTLPSYAKYIKQRSCQGLAINPFNVQNKHNSRGSYSIIAKSRQTSSLLGMSDIEVQSENAPLDVEDEDEWRTVLAAFQMYKAAFGDLKVPSRFVVPGMAPWPGEKHFVYILAKKFGLQRTLSLRIAFGLSIIFLIRSAITSYN